MGATRPPRQEQETLKEAIQQLLLGTGPVGATILQSRPDLSAVAAAARADFAHPRGASASTHTFYWFGEALTWVVRAYLLNAVGVNLDELSDTIMRRGHAPQVLDADVANAPGT